MSCPHRCDARETIQTRELEWPSPHHDCSAAWIPSIQPARLAAS